MIPGCFRGVPETDPQPAIVSALGDTLQSPPTDRDRLVRLEAELHEAHMAYEADPDAAGSLLAYGRKLGTLGRYGEAISIFSEGIRKHPGDPRFYRHRGHRFISVRQPEKAVDDLEKALALIRRAPARYDDAGLSGTPLHSTVLYYLGLSHYLSENFDRAAAAFEEGLADAAVSDLEMAIRFWHYLTLRRGGEDGQAAKILEPVTPDIVLNHNDSYHLLLLVFKGICNPESLLKRNGSSLDRATLGYGIANWHYLNGRMGQAREHFREVYEGDRWSAFGYIAAESDLARLNLELASLNSPNQP